jgi:hypothetical protein
MRNFLFPLLILGGLGAANGPSLADSAADGAAQPAAMPVTAAAPAPIAQPIVATAIVTDVDKDADMIICREIQAATGSRLGASRECHAKREWDQRRVQNQLNVFKQQRDAMSTVAPLGAGGSPIANERPPR